MRIINILENIYDLLFEMLEELKIEENSSDSEKLNNILLLLQKFDKRSSDE